MSVLAGQKITADVFNLHTRRILPNGRGRRVTTHAGTTTTVGILRLDDIDLDDYVGRTVEVKAGPLQLDSTVANDHIRAVITHTTDGSTPTTGSATLPGGLAEGEQDNTSFGETRFICTTYTPAAAGELLSLLLCVNRVNGTGTVTIVGSSDFAIEMTVADAGDDVGDTGTDI